VKPIFYDHPKKKEKEKKKKAVLKERWLLVKVLFTWKSEGKVSPKSKQSLKEG